MKKLLLLFIAVVSMGCSEDDTQVTVVNNYTGSMIGEWRQMYIVNSQNGTHEDLTDCTEFQLGYTYTFKEDGTYEIENSCDPVTNAGSTGNYTFADGVLTMTGSTDYVQKNNVYNEDGNKIGMKAYYSSTGVFAEDYYVLERQ